MRINLYLLFSLLFVYCGRAQTSAREKTDALASLVQKFYNTGAYDSLYDLGGKRFREEMGREKFRGVLQGLQGQLGKLSNYGYESAKDNVSKYKAGFDNAVVALFLSADAEGRLETFFISEYINEAGSKSDQPPFDNPLRTTLDLKVDSLARTFIARGNTASLAIGVLDNGNFYTYGYGETVRGNKKAPNGNTLYEIGSITKTFTGILLAYFAENKKLKLDDPVNKYLPDSIPAIAFNGKPVTLASLSNHSSGLPRLPSNFWEGSDRANPYKHYDDARLFSFLKNFKPVREPGAQYEYSNLAQGLLGVILERVSGKSYEQLLKEIIWQPLKMNSTRISLLKSDSTLLAQGYSGPNTMHSWEFLSLAAAGAIRSSINDLLLYARAQYERGDSPLQKAIANSHQLTFEKNSSRVALGWHRIVTPQGKKYIFHNGQTGGYFTVLFVNTDSRRAVVLLTNALVDPMQTGVDLMSWLDKS